MVSHIFYFQPATLGVQPPAVGFIFGRLYSLQKQATVGPVRGACPGLLELRVSRPSYVTFHDSLGVLPEQWKNPWLLRVYRGCNISQLCGDLFFKSFLMLKRQWKRDFSESAWPRSFFEARAKWRAWAKLCSMDRDPRTWIFSSLSLRANSLNNPKLWSFHHRIFRSQWPAFFCVLNCATGRNPWSFCSEYCFWDTRFQEVAKKEYCALIDNLVPGWRRDAQLEWGVHRHWPWPTESGKSISAPFEGMLQGRSKKQRRTEEGMYNDNLTVTGTVQD